MFPVVVAIAAGIAAVGAMTVAALGTTAILPAALIFTAAAIPLIVVDVRSRRLPHRIVLPAIAASVVVQTIVAWHTANPSLITGAILGGLVAGGGMLIVYLVAPDSLGFGDVTFSTLIGVTLGSLGLARVGLGLGLGFMVGAVIAGPAVLLRRRLMAGGPSPAPTTIPFGPALAAGSWLALCWGDAVLSLLT